MMVRSLRMVLVGFVLVGCSFGADSTTTTSEVPSSTTVTTAVGDGFCEAVDAADDVAFELTVAVEMMILRVSQVEGEELGEDVRQGLAEDAEGIDQLAATLDDAYIGLAGLEPEVAGDIDLVRPWVATMYRVIAEGVREVRTVSEFNGFIDAVWSDNPPAELVEVEERAMPAYARLADLTWDRCGNIIDGQ